MSELHWSCVQWKQPTIITLAERSIIIIMIIIMITIIIIIINIMIMIMIIMIIIEAMETNCDLCFEPEAGKMALSSKPQK